MVDHNLSLFLFFAGGGGGGGGGGGCCMSFKIVDSIQCGMGPRIGAGYLFNLHYRFVNRHVSSRSQPGMVGQPYWGQTIKVISSQVPTYIITLEQKNTCRH